MKIDLDDVLEIIDTEPELPGEMSDDLWNRFRKYDRDGLTKALRILVRTVKDCISERIRSQYEFTDAVASEDMELQYYFLDVDGSVTKKSEGLDEDDEESDTMFGSPILYVTPSTVWINDHRHADWNDNEVYSELDAGGFGAAEFQSGVIELFKGTNVEALKKFLSDNPNFEENEEFGAFIKSFAEENN